MITLVDLYALYNWSIIENHLVAIIIYGKSRRRLIVFVQH